MAITKGRPPRKVNAWSQLSKKAQATTIEAAKALYGKTPTAVQDVKPGSEPKGIATPRFDCPLERDEQSIVVVHCDQRQYPYFAVPNAARRSMWEAMQAKKQGMKGGVQDLVFLYAAHGFNGFYLEMKRQLGGQLSPLQKYWRALAREMGYKAEVANGAAEALEMIEWYFKGWPGLSAELIQMMEDINALKALKKPAPKPAKASAAKPKAKPKATAKKG